MTNRGKWLSGAALGAAAAVMLPQAGAAQVPTEAPPVRETIDGRGVDLFRGKFVARQPRLVIGGARGISYDEIYRGATATSSVYGAIDTDGATYTVSLDGRSDRFQATVSGGVTTFTATEAGGQTLTFDAAAQLYYYTSRDGTQAIFDRALRTTDQSYPYGNAGRIRQVLGPTGSRLTFDYDQVSYCKSSGGGGGGGGVQPNRKRPGSRGAAGDTETGDTTETGTDGAATDSTSDAGTNSVGTGGSACTQNTAVTVTRLKTVTNGFGFQLSFSYLTDDPEDPNVPNPLNKWLRTDGVTAKNLAGCGTGTCSWPTLASPNVAANSYTVGANGVTSVRRYGETANALTIGYDAGGRVSTLADQNEAANGESTTYTYADAGGARTVTVTDALNHATTYVFDIASERLTSVTTPPKAAGDPDNRTTAYTYDAKGRLKRTTAPDGAYAEQVYDEEVAGAGNRGNVVEVRRVGRPGTAEAQQANWLVTKASFPASCANPATCNQPTTTTDERGFVTNYVYNADGTLQSVTAPAPATGAVRPQTRYTYQSLQAKVLSGSTLVDNGLPVTLPLTVSTCRTQATCAGTADELRQVFAFDPARNLQPLTAETRAGYIPAGDTSLSAVTTYDYDMFGRLLSVNGPLPDTGGTDDIVRYRYDSRSRVVGVTSPDPDGAGPLQRRAQKLSYGSDWALDVAETGTVAGVTDADWSAFESGAKVVYSYANGLVTAEKSSVGGIVYGVRHTSYLSNGQVECVAQRMNRAAWSPLTPACTLQTTGTDGPDRITRTSYDGAGNVASVTRAYGTAVAAAEASYAYDAGGRVKWVKDARASETDYAYDGFGRLVRTTYPDAATGVPSTGADHEDVSYDKASNVTQRVLRGGTVTLGYQYDNLNRLKVRTRPLVGSNGMFSYTYDTAGRVLTVTSDPNTGWPVVTRTYDGLGRLSGETSTTLKGLTWAYDAAGRRVRQGWDDGFFVTYDYLATGEMKTIKENGSATLATYGYDDLGRRVSLTRGTGQVVTSYGYASGTNDSPFLTLLKHDLPGTANDLTSSFTYTSGGQIKAATRDNPSDKYAWTGHYNVNRPYEVNRLNQVTAAGAGGSQTSFGYDARGNLTGSGSQAFTYTADNELASTASDTELTYDGFGQLEYVSDGVEPSLMHRVGGEIATELNWQGQIVRRYVQGAGADEPLVWYEGSGTSDKRYIVADERGSVVATTDASGTAVAVNRYDEHGIPASTNAGRFGYTGQAWFARLGLYDYKARMYSPTLGRFLQTDPIGYADGMNWYGYVGGDAVNATDPSGLAEVCTGTRLCGSGSAFGPGQSGVSIGIPYGAVRSGGHYYIGNHGPSTEFINGDGVTEVETCCWVRVDYNGAVGWVNYGRADRSAERAVDTPQRVDRVCNPPTNERFFENALQVAGVIGDGLAIAGALTGNPVLGIVGLSVSVGSTALSAALNYSQGDYVGLAGDGAGFLAGLYPGGRLTRRLGGAAYDAGRSSAGRFVANWRGKQAAQNIATEGLQDRAASATVGAFGCRP